MYVLYIYTYNRIYYESIQLLGYDAEQTIALNVNIYVHTNSDQNRLFAGPQVSPYSEHRNGWPRRENAADCTTRAWPGANHPMAEERWLVKAT